MPFFSFHLTVAINSENQKITFPKPAGSTCDKAFLFASRRDVLLGQKGGQCYTWGACGGVGQEGGGDGGGPGCDVVYFS